MTFDISNSLYLARHGETDWSLTGQHTGRTDLPLTPRGEQNASRLGLRLKALSVAAVFTSPLQRARRTCQLAGFGDRATIDPDLVEWDYGDYEGLRSAEIHKQDPTWNLFRDGAPHGESVAQITARADRAIARVRAIDGNVVIFSSGHFLRVLASRWLGFAASTGQYLALDTASLSILGYEHALERPVIRLWNDTSHIS